VADSDEITAYVGVASARRRGRPGSARV